MRPAPGELYLVDLGVAGKVRPAVVVSRQDERMPRAIVVVAPLTTQYRGSSYEVSLGKLKFLDKESWINVQGLTSLGQHTLGRRLGKLSPDQMDHLRSAIRYLLDL